MVRPNRNLAGGGGGIPDDPPPQEGDVDTVNAVLMQLTREEATKPCKHQYYHDDAKTNVNNLAH